jgi:hypothetical protein
VFSSSIMEISLLCLLVFHKKDRVWRQINDGERQSNRVVDMMKKTLQDKLVPNEYWAKKMNMPIYLLNRSANKAMIEVTLEETWVGVKPKVNHLKIFGSIAHDVTTRRKLLFVRYVLNPRLLCQLEG